VNSPGLASTLILETFCELLDDPIKGMAKLAPYVYATHIKDLKGPEGLPQTSGISFLHAGWGGIS